MEYSHENDPKNWVSRFSFEPLSGKFNEEAKKEKSSLYAEFENGNRKKKTAPSMGGGRYRKTRAARHPKASTPFSIRLTPEERKRLSEDAAGEPLGTYVKTVLFAPTTKAAARRAMIDHHKIKIGQVLAMVGSSGIGDALTTMALAIQSGTFEDEAEIKAALERCEKELSEIRAALLKALGIRKG